MSPLKKETNKSKIKLGKNVVCLDDDISLKSEDDDTSINSEDDSVKSENDDVSINSDEYKVSIPSEDDVSVKSEGKNVQSESQDDNSEDYETDESGENENDSFDESNTGWASAMGKVLNIGKRKRSSKTMVLSKARKLSELKTIKKENIDSENVQEDKIAIQKANLKKTWVSQGRVKPNVLDKGYEKALQKVAVRGIVQIFNAVKTYQQGLEKNDNSKKETKLKNSSFFKLLKKGSKSVDVKSIAKTEVKDEEDKQGENWNVLRDNFMLDSKLKDWDKHEEKLTEIT